MRIIHTSDVHLDACFAGSGLSASFGNRRRQSLRDTFHAILRRAAEWPADVILIAGDLFDHDRVTRDTVAFLKSAFEAIAPVPVFIAPGNHDPYVPDSPYATEAWSDNVVIYESPRWTAHQLNSVPLTVHGFGFDGPEASQNPFGSLEVPDDGRTHVAVAHGSETSCLPPGKEAYAPFAAERAAAHGLAYLALGHYHAVKALEGDFATRMHYCGAPEGHDFSETGPRHYLEVEIDADGIRVNPVPSSRAEYAVHTVDCSSFASSQEVIDAMRALVAGVDAPQIARIVLAGTAASEWRGRSDTIYDAVTPEFDYLDLVDTTEPAEDYDALAGEATSLGAFIAQLNEEIRDATDDARKAVLERAREVGLASFRGKQLPVSGSERN